jgi:tripartite-type tricarboxylate transporter receptor subunit TctC
MKRSIGAIALGGIVAAAAFWGPAGAPDASAQYYKGKTIKMIVRSAPGGGYDFYGRLLARHMPRHIPGNPAVIVINMPGAGGIVAGNYMQTRAKRNGLEIGVLTRELALAQRTGAIGVKYDVNELISLGSAASSTFLVVLKKDHPVKSLAQLKTYKGKVLLAATGPGSGSYQYASLLKFDGFPIKVISGYSGGSERFLSIERGETHGTANSYESTRAAIEEYGLRPILYTGAPVAALKGVPHISTQLSEQGKALGALMSAPLAAGRPFFTTPGVPADRVAILRAAFKAALSDPELLKEAKRAKRKVSWTDPSIMDGLNKQILGAPDSIIALFKEGAKKPKAKMVKHSGPVTGIKKGGRRITISYMGKDVTAKVSGSRTKITLNGKKVKRKTIKVGMNCSFTYPKAGEEAAKIDCK